jgi:hypothetical protein
MFPSSIQEHYESMARPAALIRKRKLLEKAKTAAAWGSPSHESMGYSHGELCSIIYQLINYIEQNERTIN